MKSVKKQAPAVEIAMKNWYDKRVEKSEFCVSIAAKHAGNESTGEHRPMKHRSFRGIAAAALVIVILAMMLVTPRLAPQENVSFHTEAAIAPISRMGAD